MALMFMVPFSSMMGSATSGGTDGDSLIVRGRASASYAEPGKEILFSATAEFGSIPEGTSDVTSSTSFVWDFGDGSTAKGKEVRHSYSSLGTYTVKVTGTYKSYSNSYEFTIEIRYLPHAKFSVNTKTPRAYLDSVDFDASASYETNGRIVSYEWDFGDGNKDSGKYVSHTYKEGSYTVTLKVKDSDGYYDTTTMRIDSSLPKSRISDEGKISSNPKICVNDGKLKAFWIENKTSVVVSESDNFGWNWSETSVVFDDSEWNITSLQMAYDGRNVTLAIESSQLSGGEIYPFPFLYILYSRDGGDTWQGPFTLRADRASIAVKGENVYIVCREWTYYPDRPAFYVGMMVTWTDDGQIEKHRFSTPEGSDEATGFPLISVRDVNNPDGTKDTEIDVIVGYGNNGKVYFWKSSDNGNTWSQAQYVATLTSIDRNSMDLISSENRLYLIFSNHTFGNYELWMKIYDDGLWGESILITNALGTSFQPSMACDADGRVHLVWADSRECVYDIYQETMDGAGNVGDILKITNSKGNFMHPHIAIDNKRKNAVTGEYYSFEVWENKSDGCIYFKNNLVDGYVGKTQTSLQAAIDEAERYISSLPDDYFSNPVLKKNLLRKYEIVKTLVSKGFYTAAAAVIKYGIDPTMDGSQGGNSNDDWVTVDSAQQRLIGINSLVENAGEDPELPPIDQNQGNSENQDSIKIEDVSATSTEDTVYVTWKVDWIYPAPDDVSYLTTVTLNGQTQNYDEYRDSYGALFTGLSPDTEYSFEIYAEEKSSGGNKDYTDKYSASIRTQKHELKITSGPTVQVVSTAGEEGNNDVESCVKVEWWTNNKGNSTIEYRISGSDEEWKSKKIDSLSTDHVMKICGLKEDTTYEFRVRSENKDYDEKPEASGEFTTPPAIYDMKYAAGYTDAHFIWSTKENSDTYVFYKLPSDDEWKYVHKRESGKTHELTIGGGKNDPESLWSGAKYEFYVESVKWSDGTEIIMKSRVYEFQTKPMITNVQSRDYYRLDSEGNEVRGEIITWNTGVPTSGYVKYVDESVGEEVEKQDTSYTYNKAHVVLILDTEEDSPIIKDNKYEFRVYSENESLFVNSTLHYFKGLPDSDGDGLQDAEEEYGWTVKRDINGDGDTDDVITTGLGSQWYYYETLLPNGEGGSVYSFWKSDNPNFDSKDSDSDGLNDKEEKEHHTNPGESDTDYDYFNDSEELNGYHTNPLMSDTDLDGWKDWKEVNIYKTNPANNDTDGDGVIDSEDMDPLVDLNLTVKIIEGRALDSRDASEKPDIYFIIMIENNLKIINTHKNTDCIHGISVTSDIPDNMENIDIYISMGNDDDNLNFDLHKGDGHNIHIEYHPLTGRWGGDDYIGDSDGYGHSRGDGDGDAEDRDGELLFDITQNDYDGDGLVYWEELNTFHTDPSAFTNDDVDKDGLNGTEEKKYGTNPAFFNVKLKVALDWDASDEYIEELEEGLRGASNYLYNATDGYMRFDIVEIYNNVRHKGSNWDSEWNDSDIRIYNKNNSYTGTVTTGGYTDRFVDTKLTSRFLSNNSLQDFYVIFLTGNNIKDRYGISSYDANTGTVYFYSDNKPSKEIKVGDKYVIYMWPHSYPGEFGNSIKGFSHKHIYLPDYLDSDEDGTTEDHPDDRDYYRTITHEFGHYGLYLYDEYIYPNGTKIAYDKQMHTLMAYSYKYAELSTPSDYRNPNSSYETNTAQYSHRYSFGNHKSCWEVFFRKYHDIIWFDLNHDGVRDFPTDVNNNGIIDMLENYTPLDGPDLPPDAPYMIIEVIK